MPLILKPNYNQIFASQAPEQDKPAVFNNYPLGWGVESRPNNGKPTIKGFNYLQQTSDLKDLWILQNGACLPYDESIEYAEGAPVLKDGVIQYKTAGGFKSRDSVAIPTYNSAADGIDPVTGVADSAYFNVRSSSDESYIDEYQNVGGVATATGKSYLSSLGVQQQEKPASTIKDASGKDQQEINDRFIDVTLLFKEGSENATANSDVLLTAISAARLQKKGLYCEPRGTVHFNADADFSGIRYISFHADSVLLNNTQFVLGKDANTAQQHIIVFGSITNGTNASVAEPPARPLVKIFGLKQSEVKIGSCNYVQLYADSTDPQTSSIAYCNIYNTGIWSLLEITDSGAPLSWITENKFYGGRAHKIHVIGVGFQHNHNKWFSTTTENAGAENTRSEIRFINASQNTIYDNRLESVYNAGAIYFDENSRSNQVFRTCSAGAAVRTRFDNLDSIVVDLGRGNIVLDMMNVYFDKQVIASFDATSDTVFANATHFGTDNKHVRSVRNDLIQKLIPNFNYVAVRSARQLITTDIISARYGDCFIIEGDYAGNTANARIYCYDVNMNPILTDSAERLIDHPTVTTFDPNTGRYSAGAGIGADKLRNEVFLINDTRVKYVQVAVEFTTSTTVKNILVGYFTRRGYQLGQKSTFLKSKEIVIHGLPTMGWAAVGATFYNSRDKVKNLITFSAETLNMSARLSGANTLTLQNINGATNQDTLTGSVAAGDLLGVKLYSGAVHWSRVSAVDVGTKTVTLATALPENAITSAFVKVCRFAVESALHSYSARTVAADSTTINSFSVPYAQLGKRVEVVYHGDAKGLLFSGSVTSEGSVSVRCQNTTTADILIDVALISVNVFNN